MNALVRHGIWGLVAAMALTAVCRTAAVENPKERIDYWQKNYTELKPADDPRVKQAQEIFARVLNAAGKRSGVVPRLLIINDKTLIANAIPDGGIIISKKVLDICYQNPLLGDDRLAFLLSHEIAHQLKDDFWDLKFFQAVELSKEKSPEQKKALEEVQAIAGSPEKVEEILKKELQADEHAIVYASMAGYNTAAVVTEDDKVNFFEEWLKTIDPGRIPGVHKDPAHPSPKQRAETVKARLRQVLDNVELFNLGVLFYQTGEYQKAILPFNEFLKYFPSREVYHNLAASHHQLALKYYQAWKENEKPIPFKLSMAVDPSTRATKIILKAGGGNDPVDLFKENIQKAIELYQKAIDLDPSYYLSYNNLGCALILGGDSCEEAVAMLKKALKINPNSTEILNNLGVAFFYDEKPAKAKESLAKACELDPAYNAPLFNLTKIAQEEKNSADVKKYSEAYLKLDPAGSWADILQQALSLKGGKQATPAWVEKSSEKILGLEIGDYDDKVPKEWGKPVTKERRLEEEPFRINTYANRLLTLSQDDEIKLIVILDGFTGKTKKSVAIGSSERDVISAYGAPVQVLDMTQGATWLYASQGIAFQLRNGKVVSWMLF